MSARIFLSYARKDGVEAVERLRALLASCGGPDLTLWQDLRDIDVDGTVWPQIETALSDAEHLVVVVTPAALKSDYIRREWRHARFNGATVSPVLAFEISRGDLPRWLRRGEIFGLNNQEHLDKFLATLSGPGKTFRARWETGFLVEKMERRPDLLDAIKSKLIEADGGPVGVTTALEGRGGFGKSTLAAMIAQDPDVQDAFLDGVFWVPIGREPGSGLSALQRTIDKFRPPDKPQVAYTELQDATEELRRVAAHRDALIILDDVWTKSDLNPFLHAAGQAALLVTTRKKAILPREISPIPVDELLPAEALAILARDLSKTDEEQRMLEAFAERYWHWAQCMAIANGVFYRRTQAGQALGPAIEGLDEALQAGQAPGKDERDQTLTAAIEVGFEEMEPNLRERAEALVIAPEDVDLPIACLGAIWALDAYLAEDHCLNLADLGILQAVDLKAGTVRLHDNILWYLETHLSEQRRTQLHLAAVHWMRPKSGTWADLSPHNLYAWGALRHHLERAGLGEELNALLKNFSYIEARLATMGVGGLMAAYMPPPADEGAALVGRAIALGTQQISEDKRSLGQMLLGRLVHAQSAGLQSLCDDISKSIKPLIVRRSALGPIGKELIRFLGHRDEVNSVALLPRRSSHCERVC